MIFLAIFLTAVGLLMLAKPGWVWSATERWKSSGAEQPSSAYLWSIRFGGILCAVIGLVTAVTVFLL